MICLNYGMDITSTECKYCLLGPNSVKLTCSPPWEVEIISASEFEQYWKEDEP